MRVLKSDEYTRMLWRNGHGETAQVAIGPATATLEGFDWRVSMARIDGDGPFSIFPQTDRTLAVLRGDGLRISVDGATSTEVAPSSEPLSFPGDVPAAATLIGGTVTDLNVMTRRDRFRHSMRALRVARRVEIKIDCTLALLVCADEAVHVQASDETFRLSSLDSLFVNETHAALMISSDTSALVYLIEIHGA
ncbi:MAG: HutD family protein [Gemmatimonadaceae bacterium]